MLFASQSFSVALGDLNLLQCRREAAPQPFHFLVPTGDIIRLPIRDGTGFREQTLHDEVRIVLASDLLPLPPDCRLGAVEQHSQLIPLQLPQEVVAQTGVRPANACSVRAVQQKETSKNGRQLTPGSNNRQTVAVHEFEDRKAPA
jgi:hypothetical protein